MPIPAQCERLDGVVSGNQAPPRRVTSPRGAAPAGGGAPAHGLASPNGEAPAYGPTSPNREAPAYGPTSPNGGPPPHARPAPGASRLQARRARRAGRLRARRGRRARLLLVLGLGLLLAAWAGSNAPGFGPDEPANAVKALGAGTGQWTGQPGRLSHPTFGSQPGREQRIDWINRNSRAFRLPAGLDPGPAGLPCDLFRNWLPVTCLDRPHPATAPQARTARAISYVGTYEPYIYAVPGAVMARAHTARGALYAGRAVIGAIVLLLLAVAVFAAWDVRAGPLSLVGVLLALSPMVLFMGSVVGTNGIEIAAATALFTLALRFGRPSGPPRWGWPAVGVVGAVLALSRPTGPAWVLLAAVLGLVFAQHGSRSGWFPRLGAVVRHRATVWIGLVAVAVAATALWERFVQPHPGFDRAVAVQGLHALPDDAYGWVRQWIGVFGWASLPMPTFAYQTWAVGVLVVLAAAVVVGTWRQRLRLVVVLLGAAVLAVALDVLILRQTRFPVFGRYLLPLAVLLPLITGEVLTRRAARIPSAVRRAAATAVPLLVAVVHPVGLWANARRYAVGTDGPAWFFGQSRWLPPGGWPPWLGLTAAGVACLLALAIIGLADTGAPNREPVPIQRDETDGKASG